MYVMYTNNNKYLQNKHLKWRMCMILYQHQLLSLEQTSELILLQQINYFCCLDRFVIKVIFLKYFTFLIYLTLLCVFFFNNYHLLYLHVIEDMNDPQFNVIFSGDFDNDNESVMNRIVEHINYYGCKGNNCSYGDDGNDNDDDDESNDDDDESDNDGGGEDNDFFKRDNLMSKN